MIRFVLGIIILIFFGLSTIVYWLDKTDYQMPPGAWPLAVLAAIGFWLFYSGNKSMNRRKKILEISFEMMRELGFIDAQKIAGKLGLSEVKLRELLAKEQRKGVIPQKVEIN